MSSTARFPRLSSLHSISVCGNIAGGKSWLLHEMWRATGKNLFLEPHIPRTGDFPCTAMLSFTESAIDALTRELFLKFKDAPAEYAFEFQTALLVARSEQQRALAVLGGAMERCLYEDPIFARVEHANGNFTDSQLATYMAMYDTLVKWVPVPDVVLWLDNTVETLATRVVARGREADVGLGLSLEGRAYLQQLNMEYREHFAKCPRVVRVAWDDAPRDGDEALARVERALADCVACIS